MKECVDFLKKEENGKKNQLVFHQLRTFQKKVNKTMRRLILERATCKKMLLNALLFSHSNNEQDSLKRLPESFALGIPSRETQEKETDWKQLLVS